MKHTRFILYILESKLQKKKIQHFSFLFLSIKIRSEAKQCTCHIPFQITRVGEGKYTFGTSKIVRLVRVHGSSIVVRVGGGWEYLYDFLFKADPCRGKWKTLTSCEVSSFRMATNFRKKIVIS